MQLTIANIRLQRSFNLNPRCSMNKLHLHFPIPWKFPWGWNKSTIPFSLFIHLVCRDPLPINSQLHPDTHLHPHIHLEGQVTVIFHTLVLKVNIPIVMMASQIGCQDKSSNCNWSIIHVLSCFFPWIKNLSNFISWKLISSPLAWYTNEALSRS